MTRYAALIGFQRCGTHMVGGAVDSHPDAVYTNEIFYRLAVRTSAERDAILARWAQDTRLVFLDVKLNQITPVIEDFLRTIPVISIYRRDRLRHYYSGELHHYRHAQNAGKRVRELTKFKLDENRLKALDRRVTHLYDRYLYLSQLQLIYEDITQNTHVTAFSEELSVQICAVLGLSARVLTTRTVKQAPQEIGGLLAK